MIYTIRVSGCDASTRIDVELTDEEVALVRRIAEQITKTSTYSCEPRMYVFPEQPKKDDE